MLLDCQASCKYSSVEVLARYGSLSFLENPAMDMPTALLCRSLAVASRALSILTGGESSATMEALAGFGSGLAEMF